MAATLAAVSPILRDALGADRGAQEVEDLACIEDLFVARDFHRCLQLAALYYDRGGAADLYSADAHRCIALMVQCLHELNDNSGALSVLPVLYGSAANADEDLLLLHLKLLTYLTRTTEALATFGEWEASLAAGDPSNPKQMELLEWAVWNLLAEKPSHPGTALDCIHRHLDCPEPFRTSLAAWEQALLDRRAKAKAQSSPPATSALKAQRGDAAVIQAARDSPPGASRGTMADPRDWLDSLARQLLLWYGALTHNRRLSHWRLGTVVALAALLTMLVRRQLFRGHALGLVNYVASLMLMLLF
eukprot:GGOE01049502.1.p1 GENE.GGOE01049502.1~~GGOE01049502.1.p1  ORF type:complete len:319 (+),score=98.27 GGOE01049502.1:50-958(+)